MRPTRIALPLALAVTLLSAPAFAALDAGPDVAPVALDAGSPADAGPEAPPSSEPLDDAFPADEAGELVTLVRAGKWLPAFGALIILLTWIGRAALGLFGRPKSGWGKRVLAGSISALLVVAAAAKADEMSIGLIAVALGGYWTASGGYDTTRGMIKWIRGRFA
jgi:hypothetical protein